VQEFDLLLGHRGFGGGVLFDFFKTGVIPKHFPFVPLPAGKVLLLFDHLVDLILRQAVPLSHRRVVRGIEPGGLPQAGQNRCVNREMADGIFGRLDPHHRAGDLEVMLNFGSNRDMVGTFSAKGLAVMMPLNGREINRDIVPSKRK
jgi:hypothetical protein